MIGELTVGSARAVLRDDLRWETEDRRLALTLAASDAFEPAQGYLPPEAAGAAAALFLGGEWRPARDPSPLPDGAAA